ncbi:MAG: type II and III secretion system protein [Methylococcales bacterium]|nr:type II and III secretion system protein [Methylococcales bacterium]
MGRILLFLSLFLPHLATFAAETVMEIIPLSNRLASEIEPIIAPFLDESDSLIPDGFNLIIQTRPEKLREIKAVIKQLDSVLTNLTITVIQSEDLSAEQLNAGINLNILVGQNSNLQGQVTANYQQQQDNANHQQILTTLEGTAAHINVGRYLPIHQTHRYINRYGQRVVRQQQQQIEVSTGFAVLPRLNGEQVLLEISPWSERLHTNTDIKTHQAKTTLKTRLGEWIEIGAVNQQQHSEKEGLLSHQQSHQTKNLRILVKVEK